MCRKKIFFSPLWERLTIRKVRMQHLVLVLHSGPRGDHTGGILEGAAGDYTGGTSKSMPEIRVVGLGDFM